MSSSSEIEVLALHLLFIFPIFIYLPLRAKVYNLDLGLEGFTFFFYN